MTLLTCAEFRRLRDQHRLEEFEARLPDLRGKVERYRGYLARVKSHIALLRAREASRHDIEAEEARETAIWRALSPAISEIGIIERELPLLRAAVNRSEDDGERSKHDDGSAGGDDVPVDAGLQVQQGLLPDLPRNR